MTDTWHGIFDAEVAKADASLGWRTAGRPSKAHPDGEDISWWREKGEEHLATYEAWLAQTDWVIPSFDGEPAIELPVAVEIEGQSIRGFIDAVFVTGDGEMVVLDYKTGSRTPDSLLQLGLYATCLELMGYPRPSKGCFYMTRKATVTTPESLDRFDAAFWGSILTDFRTALEAGIFLPNVGSNCPKCGVRDYCYAVGGVSAYLVDPLHPAYSPQVTDN